jgi:putative CocE/NonD family hydrolase
MSRRALLLAAAVLATVLPGGALAASRAAAPTVDGSVTVAYSVPTRDATLYLEVVHPTSHGKVLRAPAILTYSPYSVLGRNGDADHWTKLGYARMYADVIGTGNSGGCYDYGGNRDKRTAHDLVEWVGTRTWSTGKVGMLGGSYDGTTQYAAAVTHPKHLTTIVPEAAIVRWWDYAFSGGLRYGDTNEDLGPQGPGAASDEGADTPLGFDLGFAVPPPVDVDRPDWAARVRSTVVPCEELQHTQEGYSPEPDNPSFWAERDYLRQLGTVTIPVLVAGNWGDWNVKQVNGWTAYHALTRSKARKLYMGTRWEGHGTPAGAGYDQAVDAWFARWLKGEKNGVEQDLPDLTTATADSAGTIGYRAPRAARTWRLSLGRTGTAWTLGPKTRQSDPAQLPWTGTATESGSLAHLDTPGQHVAFLSPVLSSDLRVLGAPSLRLRVTSPCDYATLAVSLVDVEPARVSTTGAMIATDPSQLVAVTRGWMDSRYPRDGYAQKGTLTPGTPATVTVPIKPTDYTFRKGHRLALVVQTDAVEWVLPRPCTGGAPVVEVLYGGGASALSLPLS